jgi:hypothetical protein
MRQRFIQQAFIALESLVSVQDIDICLGEIGKGFLSVEFTRSFVFRRNLYEKVIDIV